MMEKFNLLLAILFAVNIGINIVTGNFAGICGWFSALVAQIQIINSNWE